MPAELGSKSDGIAFLVGALAVYEVVAAACSSPQTAEINANTRADTLMKWVHIGLIQAGVLVTIGAVCDQHGKAIAAGGAVAGGFMYASYVYAKKCGLASNAPGTETPPGS